MTGKLIDQLNNGGRVECGGQLVAFLTDAEKIAAVEAVIAHARRITPADRAVVYVADIERALGRHDAPTPHKTS